MSLKFIIIIIISLLRHAFAVQLYNYCYTEILWCIIIIYRCGLGMFTCKRVYICFVVLYITIRAVILKCTHTDFVIKGVSSYFILPSSQLWQQ